MSEADTEMFTAGGLTHFAGLCERISGAYVSLSLSACLCLSPFVPDITALVDWV